MNLIKIWNSQDEISKHFNVNKAAINKYLRNGNKRGYNKNYIWKYEE